MRPLVLCGQKDRRIAAIRLHTPCSTPSTNASGHAARAGVVKMATAEKPTNHRPKKYAIAAPVAVASQP
jgi:flagella basal body P-ring formation protein FlgA